MSRPTIGNRAAMAAAVLTATAVSALAALAGGAFRTLHDVLLLVMTLAFAPVMLGFFRLGGRMPMEAARLYLFVGISAVGIRAFVQVAVLPGAVGAYYLDEAAIAATSVGLVPGRGNPAVKRHRGREPGRLHDVDPHRDRTDRGVPWPARPHGRGLVRRCARRPRLVVLFIVGVPVLAFGWFMCVATLSGALGSPF